MNDEKRAIFTILSLCFALASFAQGNGMAGISEATNMVTSYFDPLTKLIFAVAAILGLVGGVRVYSKILVRAIRMPRNPLRRCFSRASFW